MKTDRQLVDEINRRNPDAFETLYRRYRDCVLALARRFTGNGEQRQIVVMRFVDDMSLAEIAQALDTPLSTIKSRLYRALEILRNISYECPDRKVIPLIVASYIGRKQSELLLKEGVSWIDLSGNMLIRVPPNIYIERSGKPNRYPDSAPIKKVFQGTSSLVSRALHSSGLARK
ncbi:MAG: hypothetical protein J7M40_14905 [Planctomycetes bacterium]|nr:hypothetical protein [Planctomycetota bacterium]